MFKVSYVSTVDGLKEATGLLRRIYEENPRHWPNGLSPEHFDGGLYLIREASTGQPVGFCGWQERNEIEPISRSAKESGSRLNPYWDQLFESLGCRSVKVGYYSIGILPEHRQNGFAKEALKKLISTKAAGVDRVRAMIVASNRPSLALADSLGVEKLIKRSAARAFSGLGRMFRSPVQEGILGPEVARLARQRGVQLFMPHGWFTNQPTEEFRILGRKMHAHKALNDVLSRFGVSPRFVLPGQRPDAGVLISPTGEKIPAAMRRAVAFAEDARPFPYTRHGDVDKLREARMLSGFIPQTESLGRFMRGTRNWDDKTIQAFRARLDEKLGPQWILKPRGGFASDPGAMVTESTQLTPSIMRRLAASSHIAQQRHSLEQIGPTQSLVDDVLRRLNPDYFKNLARGTREYRVHAMGGKVVPYATSPRGSVSEYFGSYLRPFRSKRTRQIEDYVQAALNRMPENVRKMGYGFDVGMDRYGRPFIIEANPATGGNASGFVSLPAVADAYAAAVKGHLPNYVKLRNAGYMGGAGGLGYMALNRQGESAQ